MDDGGDERYVRERKKRSLAIALVLGGLVVLFFVMTIVKLMLRFGS